MGTGTSTLWDGSQCTNTSGAACADFSYTGTGYNGAFGESRVAIRAAIVGCP